MPKYEMVDYDTTDIAALKEVISGNIVSLFTFTESSHGRGNSKQLELILSEGISNLHPLLSLSPLPLNNPLKNWMVDNPVYILIVS